MCFAEYALIVRFKDTYVDRRRSWPQNFHWFNLTFLRWAKRANEQIKPQFACGLACPTSDPRRRWRLRDLDRVSQSFFFFLFLRKKRNCLLRPSPFTPRNRCETHHLTPFTHSIGLYDAISPVFDSIALSIIFFYRAAFRLPENW